MVLKCPACAKTFKVPDGVTSGRTNCPQCGQRLDLGRILRPGDLKPGTVLGGCRIEGLLGRGGMAVVYKATQVSLDRPVALKVLPKRFARSPQFVERFNREASALARLTHPNIVSILDKGVEGETYYFVMEYVEGKTLRDRLLRERKLSPQETLRLLEGVCNGLEYAHNCGVIHRDLKPGNILLDASGTPKLADFGIARMMGTDTHASRHLTAEHTVMGSADYMAPEQRANAAGVDHRADIYSLGVITYQMLMGQLPVGSFKPVAYQVPGTPTAVDRVIRTALAASPDDRYGSAAKFFSALRHAFDDAPRHAPRLAASHHRRSKTPVGLIVLVVGLTLAAVGGIAALLTPAGSSRRPRTRRPKPRPATRTAPATRHTPKPAPRPQPKPRPKPKNHQNPPRPAEEPPAVRKALAPIREHIAEAPDDFPAHVAALKRLLLSSGNPQVLVAARKEMNAVVERLEKALDDHFAAAQRRADALMDKRAYAAAVRAVAALPPNLFTSDAKKRADELANTYRARCWKAFEADQKRAAALLEEGKVQEALALFENVRYPSAELQHLAEAEIAKIEQATAARRERIRKEQAEARAKLAERMRTLWAQRRYADALARVNDAIAKAPDDASREALAPYKRAAALLAAFWKNLVEAINAQKGNIVAFSSDVKYTIKGLEGDEIVLALPVGTVKRGLRKLPAGDLYILVRNWLDTAKKPDDNLMLGMFFTHDAKPDPAAAARYFDKAIALGAKPQLVAWLRNLEEPSASKQPGTDQPKPKQGEPPPEGYAIDLNGVSDYVEVPDDRRKRSLRLRAFTIEAWVWWRPAPGPALERYVVAKNAGWTNSVSFAIYTAGGRWAYATGDGIEADPVVTRVPVTQGAWTHCALVYDDGLRTLFIDGKPVHRSRAKQRISFDDKPLFVGAVSLDGNAAHFWKGGIDEVRLTNGARYRKEFTPERKPKTDDATHLMLHFEDAKGTRAKDESRFANHGTLRGAARFLPVPDFQPPPRPGPPRRPPGEAGRVKEPPRPRPAGPKAKHDG